ncbi:MAG: hypothetical protein JXQ97_15100 [Natronospirillum sp.]
MSKPKKKGGSNGHDIMRLGNEAKDLRASLAETFLISAAIVEEMRAIRQAIPLVRRSNGEIDAVPVVPPQGD